MRLPLLREVLTLEAEGNLKDRQQALQFYNKLVSLLSNKEDEVIANANSFKHKGDIGIHFSAKLVDPKYSDAVILLLPQKYKSEGSGGFGATDANMGYFGFPGLEEDYYDLSGVLDYITTNKSNVVHEFMHYLDWKRDPQAFLDQAKQLSTAGGGRAYDAPDAERLNTKYEFNAYVTQAIHDYMEDLDRASKQGNSHRLSTLLPDNEQKFKELLKKKYVYHKFLKILNPENAQELEKILSSLYLYLKKSGT
jgi:hypothetical protein